MQLADPHVENWWRAYRPTYGQVRARGGGGGAHARRRPRITRVSRAGTAPRAGRPGSRHPASRSQIVRTRSNFMQDPIGPLFEGVGTKVQHKFWDNIFDVVPPFVALIVTMKMSEEAWREHGKEHWG